LKDATPRVTAFAPGGAKTFAALLCPGYRCEGVTSISALLDTMRDRSAAHPGARMLATLDDVGQASYTSGHTIDANALDPIADDDTIVGEDDEPPLPDLSVRLARLVEAAGAVTLDQMRNRLWWTGEHRLSYFDLQDAPDEILDPKAIYIQAVPVTHAWETIAAFPNGYFQGDLSPMENLVLARHLEEAFGYELFGIGASYVGFRRRGPASAEQLRDLARFVVELHAAWNEPDLTVKVSMALAASDLLFLAYVDR
jgi:hypothetical protein